MVRFMMLTFAVLGWGFYELSGGSDFVPVTSEFEASADVNTVARADSSAVDLLTVTPSSAQTKPVGTPRTTTLSEGVQPASFLPEMPAELPRQVTAKNSDRATRLVRLDAAAPSAASELVKAALSDIDIDMRIVNGGRVNMRNGPGTSFSVLGKLARGATVEVLQDPGDGWVKLRVAETGRVGWMADFLLSSAD